MPTALAHDGAVINIRVHGSGPTVLAHPLTVNPGAPPEAVRLKADLERSLIERLSSCCRLVLFDYPGQPPKPSTLTPANVVTDLLAIADAAGADQFAWCGYSWTAVIGIQLAIATDRLTGLICGGWPPVSGPYTQMLEVLLARQPDESRLSPSFPPELQQVITFYRGLQSFDDQAAQQQITCPRLCFAGTADDIYDLGIGRTVIDKRSRLEHLGWDVHLLAGLDHMQVLQPEVFVPVVSDWLDGRTGN